MKSGVWHLIIENKRMSAWLGVIFGYPLAGIGGWQGFLDQTGIIAIITIVTGAAVYNEVRSEKREQKNILRKYTGDSTCDYYGNYTYRITSINLVQYN